MLIRYLLQKGKKKLRLALDLTHVKSHLHCPNLSAMIWLVYLRYCKNQYEFEHFVKDAFVLPKIHDLILEGPGQTSVYKKKRPVFSGCPVFNMLALKIDFSESKWSLFRCYESLVIANFVCIQLAA